jgi:quinol-cytochrome oxidoreductase complex cytochrome b subunit
VLLVQGGPEISARTLTRVYAVHVLLIPLFLAGAVAFHLYLVVFQGTTSPTERRRPVATAEEQRRIYNEDKESGERGEKFHPCTTAKSGTMAFIVFAHRGGAGGARRAGQAVSPGQPGGPLLPGGGVVVVVV